MPTTKVPASRMVDHNIGSYCFRNKIINGDMRIDQRNAGALINLTGNGFVADRWVLGQSVASTYTVQQVSDAPAGFINSARITLTTTRSPAAGDIYCLLQRIEGQNMYDLAWGTSAAKTVTVSFWVKMSTTGTYSARFGGGQSYVFTFTVNQSNTWEYKAITVPGSIAGTWATDNTTGIDFLFSLGTGSTRRTPTPNQWLNGDFHGTTDSINFVTLAPGATFQITGVQLEVGPTATPFEYRPIGTELALCQRYYYRSPIDFFYDTIGTSYNTLCITRYAYHINAPLPVEMRTIPDVTLSFKGSRGAQYASNFERTANSTTFIRWRNGAAGFNPTADNQSDVYMSYTASAEL